MRKLCCGAFFYGPITWEGKNSSRFYVLQRCRRSVTTFFPFLQNCGRPVTTVSLLPQSCVKPATKFSPLPQSCGKPATKFFPLPQNWEKPARGVRFVAAALRKCSRSASYVVENSLCASSRRAFHLFSHGVNIYATYIHPMTYGNWLYAFSGSNPLSA